jgi:hypothetical protein
MSPKCRISKRRPSPMLVGATKNYLQLRADFVRRQSHHRTRARRESMRATPSSSDDNDLRLPKRERRAPKFPQRRSHSRVKLRIPAVVSGSRLLFRKCSPLARYPSHPGHSMNETSGPPSRRLASGRLRIDGLGLAMGRPMNFLDDTGLFLAGKRRQRDRCSRAN